MSNIDRTVFELKSVIAKGFLQKSDIAYLMTLFRVLLEAEKIQNEYPYLNLYSTWVVHPQLTRNTACLRVLVDLTSVFSKADAESQKLEGAAWINYFHSRVNKALGFPQLRKDIIAIERRFGLPKGRLPIDRVWKDFALILVSCLFERPIKLPDKIEGNKQAKETHDAIKMLSEDNPRKEIVEVVFLHREKAAVLGDKTINLPISNDVYWRLRTSLDFFIMGPLQLI